MVDFFRIVTQETRKGVEIIPKFRIGKSSDLMIRGGDFYAVWVEERGMWSTDEQDVIDIVDRELDKYADKHPEYYHPIIKYMWDASSGSIDAWHKYCQKQSRDNYTMLDEKLIFANDKPNKKDYASKRLSYSLEPGDYPAYEKLISTLYSPEERHKIEWAIGAIVTGESKYIQKFMVLYGSHGTGKSTILNIIQQLFEGYYSIFDAKSLGSNGSAFALEAFKTNPLVAIQHDGDLSRIEDNTRLNSLVSHEEMTVNEKYKSTYTNNFKAFLFMGTNNPVKITDAKSGLIRRLIDVTPSGKKVSPKEYSKLVNQVKFELGAIACHCRDVYLEDPDYYDDYIPMNMMEASNDFYNFIMDSYSIFLKNDSTTLNTAWSMYKEYCEEAKLQYQLNKRIFKEELKNYFWDCKDSKYTGFRTDKFETVTKEVKKEYIDLIDFNSTESIFDKECADCFAQYGTDESQTPRRPWDEVTSKLEDLDTRKLHYVRVPENHIVIDFDIPDEKGGKSYEKNLEAASKFPPTYAELSKSGCGIHLHYIYNGDVNKLSRVFDEHIEVKVFTGKSSLRRKLSKCNDLPIATINSGLPLKGDDKVINFEGVKNEKHLRTMIRKNLDKGIHSSTKCSIDFIDKLLSDAYDAGLNYDVTDLRNEVYAFAANSTNQSDYCIKLVSKMKFKSEDISESVDDEEAPIAFYDIEVFPNLFLVNWKLAGEENPVIRMINPKPAEIEELMKFRLIGFNCRRYDNHILYAAMMGYTNEELYNLSMKIINSKKGENMNCFFGEAYNISYTDVYDFAAKKQSLKKWEIELDIHHQELGLPWDQPVPEERWIEVAEYCDNDVLATEAVFNHTKGDFTARQILADLAGMNVNSTTNQLTTRIIFGKERKPKLIYTDLATGEQYPKYIENKDIINSFPGYEFVNGKNIYRNTDIGKGGYIVSFPGVYGNAALLDIQSLHPNSVRAMNCFGEYTKNFTDILDARVAIKHKDYDTARTMLDGRLAPYLEDESTAKDLAQALKIAINSVYGLTAANFENPFRDVRNKNNIVALRGALFMRTLQDEVENRGYKIVAIKTDSIKIADATKEIIDFCMDFAKKYGYTFEFEAFYDKICQVNDADYIAKYKDPEYCEKVFGYVPGDNAEHPNQWTVTGAKFAVSYVFKTLFSKEEIEFEDLCETKSVTSSIYLDFNEALQEGEHDYHFVGKVGLFCPIKPGRGGGELVREAKDKQGNTKYDSVNGAKGYRWMESEVVEKSGKKDDIDYSYYDKLVNDAVDSISQYTDFEWFVSDEEYISPPRTDDWLYVPENVEEDPLPWG